MAKEPGAGFARLLHITTLVEDWILIVLLATMIVLAGTQILLRNLFDTGIFWADPLLRILVLWVALAGAIVAARQKNLISVNVLLRFMPARLRIGCWAITDVFTCVISAVLAYHSARFVLSEREAATVAFAAVPSWVAELIIPITFGVISLHYLIFSVIHVKQLITGQQQK